MVPEVSIFRATDFRQVTADFHYFRTCLQVAKLTALIPCFSTGPRRTTAVSKTKVSCKSNIVFDFASGSALMEPPASIQAPSKSACALKKGGNAILRSRSDVRFVSQYGNAPRKVLMRPPCETLQIEADNPLTLITDATVQAVFILNDRFYDDLRRRQLLAVDKVLNLQGEHSLWIEQVEVLSCLIKAVINKMANEEQAFADYSERLVVLLCIASRKVTSQSLNALHSNSGHLRDLYDVVGNVLAVLRTRLVGVTIPVVGTLQGYAKEEVASGSQTDFAVNIISAITYSTILPSLVVILLEVYFTAHDMFTPLLEILRDYLDFFPACGPILLQQGLVNRLVEVVDALSDGSADITSHRHEKFLISGLLCRLCSGNSKDENAKDLIADVFSENSVVEALLVQSQRYLPAVHDTDRLIRNTYAVIFSLLLELALQNVRLASALLSSGSYRFYLQLAVRPECPVSDTRLQMHKLDCMLKHILLKIMATSAKSKNTDEDFDSQNITTSLLYYLAPFGEHERSFWSREQYESIRGSAIDSLVEVFPRVVAEFVRQGGSRKVLRLLNGLISLDTEHFCLAQTNDFQHSNLIKDLIDLISAILCTSTPENPLLADFLVAQEGACVLTQVLTIASEESQLMGKSMSTVLIRNVLSILSYSAAKDPTVLEVIQRLAFRSALRLFQRDFRLEEPMDKDIVKCLFASTATWTAGYEEAENQFLLGKCPERLVSLLNNAPKALQCDLLKQLEAILLKSFRITKYLEYTPAGTDLIDLVCRLWRTHENLRLSLHSLWILLKETWTNVDYVKDKSSLAQTDRPEIVETISAIDSFVLRQIKAKLTSFLEENKQNDAAVKCFEELISLSATGAVTSFGEDMADSVAKLGDYGSYLSSLCNEVYREITGRNVLEMTQAPPVCLEGKEELPSALMPQVRSDSTFQY
ncbi:hypothetical protein RvY_12937 [Ramazzottius varieornatus]|uniref:Cilia- and flagella-associated protein 69 ARM repeats domain-containing protein n=1 Tax=Ramazzottius varieornatus TaxID=947166 RepID=A0A1D1VN52_RAMVA|nr:hypothetical protein RvY_12937 [Ramazzottius varieornatus]